MQHTLKPSRRIAITAAVLIGILTLTACGEDTSSEQNSTSEQPQNSTSVSAEGINLNWDIEGDKATFTLEAPTTGWVAVGFNPTRMMQDANLIIGYVENGEAAVRDDFGNYYTSHDSDLNMGGSDDVADFHGTESEGTTSLTFTIPLDSGDEYDQPLTPGEELDLILAYGDTDDFDTIHNKATKTTVTF
ncbi:MAG: DOMON domain-containing protein [Spirochaetia bacterium]|nr:DOMON domain-containing protein [Spirochaetia bacterium]